MMGCLSLSLITWTGRAVTEMDIKILETAIEILGDGSHWKKGGDRLCFYDEQWSLFCSLAMASVDIAEKYKHRRVAIQEVRFTIDDNFPERWEVHRLMDFNNHSATVFEDIKWVLEETKRRLLARYQGNNNDQT